MKKLFNLYRSYKLRKKVSATLDNLRPIKFNGYYANKTKRLISNWLYLTNPKIKKRILKLRHNYICQRISCDKKISSVQRSYLLLINSLIYTLLLEEFNRKYFLTNLPSFLSR